LPRLLHRKHPSTCHVIHVAFNEIGEQCQMHQIPFARISQVILQQALGQPTYSSDTIRRMGPGGRKNAVKSYYPTSQRGPLPRLLPRVITQATGVTWSHQTHVTKPGDLHFPLWWLVSTHNYISKSYFKGVWVHTLLVYNTTVPLLLPHLLPALPQTKQSKKAHINEQSNRPSGAPHHPRAFHSRIRVERAR
jgi:hypothetical protein